MKKIDITDYTVEGQNIKFKESIVAILFHPQLNLNYLGLFANNKLANKIEGCADDTILLENSEYDTLVKAVKTLTCYGRGNVELVDRIIYAKTAEIQEKSNEKKDERTK